jgi:hypothetical protein
MNRWNQVTFQESTDKILPNLDELHHAIRRIAFDINNRMANLQSLVEANTKDDHIQTLKNLRNCVQSAASVVSSASTTLGVNHLDQFSVTYGSDFGDCFPSEPGETMLRWISSNTVYEFENDRDADFAQGGRTASEMRIQKPDETVDTDQSDSDTDLELEMVQALLKQGQEMLAAEDFKGAERHFRNCLSRASLNGSLASMHRTPKSEIVVLLLKTYRQQKKWSEAQSLLMEKIALESRGAGGDNSEILSDMLVLVDILLEKRAHAEALLYGRRALKGYRRLGSSGTFGVERALRVLMQICRADGNVDEEDAYGAMLSDFLKKNLSQQRGQASTGAPTYHKELSTIPETQSMIQKAPRHSKRQDAIFQEDNQVSVAPIGDEVSGYADSASSKLISTSEEFGTHLSERSPTPQ